MTDQLRRPCIGRSAASGGPDGGSGSGRHSDKKIAGRKGWSWRRNPLSPGSRSRRARRKLSLLLLICAGAVSACSTLSGLLPVELGPGREVTISVNGREVSKAGRPAAAAQDPAGHAAGSAVEDNSSASLAAANAPMRDLRDLALRLRPDVGVIPEAVASPEYSEGDRISFWVSNLDLNRQFQIQADLRYKNEVVYVWVQEGRDPDLKRITFSADRFARTVYPRVRAFFGSESNPGIDSDPRLHLLHAAGLGFGIAGYYSSADAFSNLANPYSNQKDMFYINLDWLESIRSDLEYENVLAHEFQHMVHWNNDRNEETWVNEGMSELAQEVAGYLPDTGFARVYAANPDTQLNTWNVDPKDNGRHYGASYLFMAYFLQRFGGDLTRAVVSQPANGIQGFNAALQEAGLGFRFADVFADWVVANYVNSYEALGSEGVFGYEQLEAPRPAAAIGRALQKPRSKSVANFGVDYIVLDGGPDLTFRFQGATVTRFADVAPYSGEFAWWSNRADDSDFRLTRAFDFSSVPAGESLSMRVRMWFDVEADYDYGYVLASRDGKKWEILPGRLTTTANPSGNSFGHGYTGRSGASDEGGPPSWVQDSFDLSGYAGGELLLRFEYVTDDAVNAPGWFIDDIRIPAIGYEEDFENGAGGWESEGWLLTDNRLPQSWLVQVMAFRDGELAQLVRAPVASDGATRVDLGGLGRGNEVVLAISGLTSATTERAHYEYRIERR